MNDRTIDLHFRVSEEELELILTRMNNLGFKSRSAYFRKMAIDGEMYVIDMKEVREIGSLLSRCSNNINQITKVAHNTGSIFIEDIQLIQDELQGLKNNQKELIKLLALIK